MRIEIVTDAAAVAARAADIICGAVRAKPGAVLGLPTGATPVAAYAEIARRVAAGEADLSRATVFAIDEFAGCTAETPGTNAVFFRDVVRFPLRAVRCPDPGAGDPDAHIRSFAGEVRAAGGFDLCVLGIGETGHVAFNEPGAARDSRARCVTLTETSRRAHAANFGAIDRVPLRGMTLGIADLLEARALLVLAQGAHKAAIVHAAIDGPETPDVPASWLRGHADVTWLLDAAAASGLARR